MTTKTEPIDISPLVSSESAHFPGFNGFNRKVDRDFKKGDPLVHSTVECSLHLGAHADAPSHYHKEGGSIEERDLNFYWGPCQVLHVPRSKDGKIFPEHLDKKNIHTPRILFKTDSHTDPNVWNEDFHALSAELIEYLATQKVILVGIDTPSIDPSRSKVLEAHLKIFENNMAILEGLVLNAVEEGSYTLMALPLKIKDADASPVRAVLFEKGLL